MKDGQRGRKADWKSPFEWTDEEVNALVVKEVGHDILFPVGFRVLLKLWVPPEQENGVFIPETIRNNETSITGMVIGMGADAFRNPSIFPSGPWCSYGDWVVFRTHEDQKIKIYRQHMLAYVTDERILSLADGTEIQNIQSTFKLEETHKELGG